MMVCFSNGQMRWLYFEIVHFILTKNLLHPETNGFIASDFWADRDDRRMGRPSHPNMSTLKFFLTLKLCTVKFRNTSIRVQVFKYLYEMLDLIKASVLSYSENSIVHL